MVTPIDVLRVPGSFTRRRGQNTFIDVDLRVLRALRVPSGCPSGYLLRLLPSRQELRADASAARPVYSSTFRASMSSGSFPPSTTLSLNAGGAGRAVTAPV